MIQEDKRTIRLEHGYYGFDMTISPKEMDLEDLSVLFKIIGLWISFTQEQLDEVIKMGDDKPLASEYVWQLLQKNNEKDN